MNENISLNDSKKVYIRGLSLISLLLFVLFLVISVRGLVYFLLNWEYMSIGSIGLLIAWILIPCTFASTTFVKIYFLDDGIMVEDHILWSVKKFFYPYYKIEYLNMSNRKFEFKIRKHLSYKYLINKKDISIAQNGINIYREWRDKNYEI